MVLGRYHNGTVGMALQTPGAWLTVEDLITGATHHFLRTVAQYALSRRVPEHNALRLIQRIDPIRGLR
jgi:hypothetical protein